ncbi:MAG: radical SAM protein [Actinobacteria bacterium]|nr:radical SAM protein [Actinomycetota bacterium]
MNNLLTGALDIIDNNTMDKLPGDKLNMNENSDEYPLSTLIERGYYYKEPDAENKLFNELFENFKKKLKNRPIKFVFCPTFNCNLKCSYCFEKDLTKKSDKFMSDELYNYAINTIKEIPKNNGRNVSSIELFGGEPLLTGTKQMVGRILKFASEQNIKISIITNGVMAKEFIDILKPVKSNVEMLQITLDGPDFIHDKRRKFYSGKGSFKNITESINSLVVNGINTNARINIDMENIEYLPHLYEFIDKMKWFEYPNFKIQPSKVTDHSSLECHDPIVPDHMLLEKLIEIYDDYPHLEDVLTFYLFKPLRHILDILNGAENVSPRYFNCESNLIELYILCPDGYIYTCPESIGITNTAIGKFYPDLIFFEDQIKMWTERNITNLKECQECRFSPICGGGCPYSSILIYKDSLHPVCENYQEVLDTFFKYRGEKILQKFLT